SQEPRAAQMPGYSAQAAARQARAEAAAIAIPDTATARNHVRALTAEPHVAGTPAQERTRDYVLDAMASAGLRVEARQYEIFLPHATAAGVWRIAPDTLELDLAEPAIEGDPGTALMQYPTVNGYSGAGDASGDLVYVNF